MDKHAGQSPGHELSFKRTTEEDCVEYYENEDRVQLHNIKIKSDSQGLQAQKGRSASLLAPAYNYDGGPDLTE